MSRLKVLLRGTPISDIQLDQDKEYIGGRKESCDIRLQAEKGISREHFKLKYEEGKWVLSTLSRFGEIFSLGQRVETTPLEHGQIFQVPPYEFAFKEHSDGDSVVNYNQKNSGPIDENERTVIGVTQQVPYIKMMSASGEVREMLRLEVGDAWVAGRDPSCQIIIPDQRVSKRQFEIRKNKGAYSIIDLSSVNGTFVNGTRVSTTDPYNLKSGDTISVIDNIMYFELHDPNFQYRVDRLEVPPIQAQEAVSEQPDYIEQAPEEYVQESYVDDPAAMQYMQTMDQQGYYDPYQGQGGGPYIQGDPNQQGYAAGYNQYQQAPTPEAAAATLSSWEKFKNNKPVFISTIILILVGAYFLSDYLNPAEVPVKKEQVVKSDNPFDNLSKEQQALVKQYYQTAEAANKSNSWYTAREQLEKLHKILPSGYLDSLSYEINARQGEQQIIAAQEQERRLKIKAEEDKVIADTIEKCEKIAIEGTTIAQIEECVSPLTTFDPNHPDKLRLIDKVTKLVNDKNAQIEKERLYQEKVEAMKVVFEQAENVNRQGYPKKTILAYEKVLEADLPDPNNFKALAKDRIQYIKKSQETRNKSNIANAEVFLKDGKFKQGILALREASFFDPDNREVREKIDKYTNELRNKVKVIYQEAIMDENYGYVESNGERPGAKDKWKQIIELDLEDGDYYRKAFIKLRKYGVL